MKITGKRNTRKQSNTAPKLQKRPLTSQRTTITDIHLKKAYLTHKSRWLIFRNHASKNLYSMLAKSGIMNACKRHVSFWQGTQLCWYCTSAELGNFWKSKCETSSRTWSSSEMEVSETFARAMASWFAVIKATGLFQSLRSWMYLFQMRSKKTGRLELVKTASSSALSLPSLTKSSSGFSHKASSSWPFASWIQILAVLSQSSPAMVFHKSECSKSSRIAASGCKSRRCSTTVRLSAHKCRSPSCSRHHWIALTTAVISGRRMHCWIAGMSMRSMRPNCPSSQSFFRLLWEKQEPSVKQCQICPAGKTV